MVELLNIDCMEYMAGLPDKAFDIAIVDPPYGIGLEEGNNFWVKKKFANKGKTWDSQTPSIKYFDEVKRVSANQIIFGANYYPERLTKSMGWVCWFKTNECVGRQFSECEFIYTSFNRAARIVEIKPFQKGGIRIHPTQKPVSLYAWLIKNYCQGGWKILDTHLGSGSSAIAAEKMGFDFVGCEIDKDYYDAAVKRFKKETDLGLFGAVGK